MRPLLACSVLLSVFACRDSPSLVACTQIGCANGLAVAVASNPPGPWRVEVIAPGVVSRQFDCPSGAQCFQAFFEGFLPGTVTVRVTANGVTQQHDNLTPTPRVTRPNGTQCPPECNQPLVTVPLPQP